MRHWKPNRLREFDYSTPWWYYITICTYNHKELFGAVNNEQMVLNEMGVLAHKFWEEIPEHFTSVELDYYVIMPNHIHGILILNDVDDAKFASSTDRTKMLLCRIIQQYKRIVTCKIRETFNYQEKIWQRSFYDRIIRNDNELFNIRRYIEHNPMKWELERNVHVNVEL